MRTESGQTIFLSDYRPSPYRITAVSLEVKFVPETCRVRALLSVEPREDTAPGTPLVLDGDELTLTSVAIEGLPLMERAYVATPDSLTIVEPPAGKFVLDTEVEISPEGNTRLMGLYRSTGGWCTQCEPEGFRRITYFLDRPDNLATYRVKMIADKAAAPVLLGNGNLVEKGDGPDGMHFAVWDDPFPKPSYLFAMVAADLGSIHDSFTTASGRQVALGIYCGHGKEEQCGWAMDSLKRSMRWDEQRFGREYDLDVFNIVAVSDFNFGAMENKGLNIFNDKLVFAQPDTATDGDYESIERVIAHEYFHNWTGNRITCRDWFQLCLKEGLTVYRDQEFTSDERSRAVKRIEDVRLLRATQFVEDAGPLAHPPRPDRYREINNFYTTTVYEKGAEVVRMLATLLGQEGFRRGLDLYFDRHDGQATTIEAFLLCFEEANGVDLGQFSTWYTQAGTPQVTVSDSYDAATQSYTLTLSQQTQPTPDEPLKQPLVIPIRFGLIGPNGSPMGWDRVSGATVAHDDLIVLDKDTATLTFTGIANRPVPSLFRGFSAPVTIQSSLSEDDQLFLARNDTDPFNRWQALQDACMRLLLAAVGGRNWSESELGPLREAFRQTLDSTELDNAFKALALAVPAESVIARAVGTGIDPGRIHEVRKAFVSTVFGPLAPALAAAYQSTSTEERYRPDPEGTGRRSLRNAALGLLVRSGADGAEALLVHQYQQASNMTDRFAALSISGSVWTKDAPQMLADFRQRFAADPLVLDKWLSVTASAPDDAVLDRIRQTLADPDFPRNNPNRLRALVGTFAMSNPVQFGRADGAGFRFVTEFVADVDERNPQVAARVLTAFRVWRNYEPRRQKAAEEALNALQGASDLSRNTQDILSRTLAGAAA